MNNNATESLPKQTIAYLACGEQHKLYWSKAGKVSTCMTSEVTKAK